MAYERSTNAQRRALARSQTRFSHISLWYDKPEDGSKDVNKQIKRTATKRLTEEEREKKMMKRKSHRNASRSAMLSCIADMDPVYAEVVYGVTREQWLAAGHRVGKTGILSKMLEYRTAEGDL